MKGWEAMSRWERAEEGRRLRELGLSYGEIMALIPVKKSTLATWCRDIELTEKQIEDIKMRRAPAPGIPRNTQRKRRREIELIRRNALDEAKRLSAEPLWVAGTALYWGEGFKTQSTLGMANAEPEALRLFMTWARTYHDSKAEFRARLNIHADNDEAWARQWWQRELRLEAEDFTKSFVKPDGTGHRKNHLPYGVCALSMRRSANAMHRTRAWLEFAKGHWGG